MKRTNRFSKITSFFAICAGITSACICVLLIAGEHHSARSRFEIHNREVQGWEACRLANPGYYEASEKAVSSSMGNLAQSQGNFWVKMPKVQLAGFLALGGLGSAAVGYLAIWAVVLMGRSGIRRFLRYREFCRLHGCPN
jgi:hypothetical protein